MNQLAPNKRYPTQETGRFEKYGTGEIGELYMKNISSSGACFKLLTRRVHFESGDVLRFKMSLGTIRKERVVNAEVMWNDGENIGVKFIRPDEVWQKLVEKRF